MELTINDVAYTTDNAMVLTDGRQIICATDFGKALLKSFKTVTSDKQKQTILSRYCECCKAEEQLATQTPNAAVADPSNLAKLDAIRRLMDFFKEFEFDPSYRFVNSFAYLCSTDIESAKKYVKNYFAVSGNMYAQSIAEKIKTEEFTLICKSFAKYVPSKQINTRFTVLYGPQGTGKTTRGLKLTNGQSIPCHSGMLPQDLMEDFTFVDGKSTFKPSALQKAMVNGTKVMLDEINLLPFESIRFLQSILDGKASIIWKGEEIKIADGFEVIGTMNLHLGGQIFGLTEPLIDRASVIDEMVLTAEDLLSALD